MKIKYIHAINLVLMENIMGESAGEAECIYDLKGSLFARTAKREKKLTVQKDQNFLENKDDRMKIDKRLQDELIHRF